MPFCPKCRDEFQDWVKVCPDCKIELVEKLDPLPLKEDSMLPIPPMPAPTKGIITAATFYFPAEAHLAATKLNSEGIWSFVADENIGKIYGGAFGGIKVQVREEDAKNARKILRPMVQKSRRAAYRLNVHHAVRKGKKCPRCHSTDIQYEKYNIRLAYLMMFLIGLVFPFFKRKWKCNACGYEWKEKT